MILILAALLGAVVGSTLSALVPRLVSGEGGWTSKRSMCPHCRSVLGLADLLPIVSFLSTGGKCRHCRKPIPAHHLVIELLSVASFIGFAWKLLPIAPTETLVALGVLLVLLLAIGYYDALTMEIPYILSLPALAVAIVLLALPGGPDVRSALIGAAGVAAFYLLQWWLVPFYYRAKAKRLGVEPPDGVVGLGDALLGAIIGLTLGWQHAILALYFAYMAGVLVSIPLLLRKKAGGESAIPFGPFLVAGWILAIIWGDVVLAFYLRTLGS